MYRNTIEILSDQKILIDAGSLWRKEGELMILEDEDQYVTAPYLEEVFVNEEID